MRIRRIDGQYGFTLIEVVIVMGIVGMLLVFGSLTLFQSRQRASLDTTAQQIMNDVRQQQMSAMLGASASGVLSSDYSIRFDPSSYTLFPGDTYISGDPANTVVPLDASLTTSSTFPSNMVTFRSLSGDISGFLSGYASLTLRDIPTGATRILELNRYGVFVKGL